MACRCNERREAIMRGIKAVTTGDTKTLADQAQVFSKSIRDDARDFRAKIATARASLQRR